MARAAPELREECAPELRFGGGGSAASPNQGAAAGGARRGARARGPCGAGAAGPLRPKLRRSLAVAGAHVGMDSAPGRAACAQSCMSSSARDSREANTSLGGEHSKHKLCSPRFSAGPPERPGQQIMPVHAVCALLCAALMLAYYGQHQHPSALQPSEGAPGPVVPAATRTSPRRAQLQAPALQRVLGGTVNLCAPPMSCAVNPTGGGSLSASTCIEDAGRASSST